MRSINKKEHVDNKCYKQGIYCGDNSFKAANNIITNKISSAIYLLIIHLLLIFLLNTLLWAYFLLFFAACILLQLSIFVAVQNASNVGLTSSWMC